MKAVVVYESMFGNTRQIAEAIAAGLAESADVAAVEVSEATAEAAEAADLLVAGGPTHAFSMSRPSTRSDAVNRGAPEGRDGTVCASGSRAAGRHGRCWRPSTPGWPACGTGRDRQPGPQRKSVVTTGTSSLHRRCRSTSTMSTGRCSTVSSTGPGLGPAAGRVMPRPDPCILSGGGQVVASGHQPGRRPARCPAP